MATDKKWIAEKGLVTLEMIDKLLREVTLQAAEKQLQGIKENRSPEADALFIDLIIDARMIAEALRPIATKLQSHPYTCYIAMIIRQLIEGPQEIRGQVEAYAMTIMVRENPESLKELIGEIPKSLNS